jgi:hypothetical protein
MDRIIEERQVGNHKIAISGQLTDEEALCEVPDEASVIERVSPIDRRPNPRTVDPAARDVPRHHLG